jgi:hypothetical protein
VVTRPGCHCNQQPPVPRSLTLHAAARAGRAVPPRPMHLSGRSPAGSAHGRALERTGFAVSRRHMDRLRVRVRMLGGIESSGSGPQHDPAARRGAAVTSASHMRRSRHGRPTRASRACHCCVGWRGCRQAKRESTTVDGAGRVVRERSGRAIDAAISLRARLRGARGGSRETLRRTRGPILDVAGCTRRCASSGHAQAHCLRDTGRAIDV